MADVDIDPFGDHDKTENRPNTGESIYFTPRGEMGERSTWGPEGEQETSFGGGKLKKEGSLIITLTVCTRSYLSILVKPRV